MNIKTMLISILTVSALTLSGCGSRSEIAVPQAEGDFDFTILKAGQADAIVLKTENHSVVIDCGEKDDGGKIVEYFAENNITKADYIFITHFDKDHVGGFPETVENVCADKLVVPDYEGSNGEYKKYLKAVEKNELNVMTAKEDFSFLLDDTLFEVSVPKKKDYDEGDNDYSLVISVTHGENTFLFTGDAEKERISEIISEFDREYDFLKVPHHGRYNENTPKLAESVKPRYSVICDSKKNPAEEETIQALENAGSRVYCTKDGAVRVSSNGKDIEILQ